MGEGASKVFKHYGTKVICLHTLTMGKMSSQSTVVVGARITQHLRRAMNEYIRRDTHLNESDFIRAAIREKIKRDAPHLIKIKE